MQSSSSFSLDVQRPRSWIPLQVLGVLKGPVFGEFITISYCISGNLWYFGAVMMQWLGSGNLLLSLLACVAVFFVSFQASGSRAKVWGQREQIFC